jgi:Na+/proline symporter
MSPELILSVFILYTLIIFSIAWFTSRKADNQSFFIGNNKSPWFIVAYGMIGASLSGVTFISVPGWVGTTGFSYMVIVFGYVFGYLVISLVLLPMYYRLRLTSIYTYLDGRFGGVTYKTGASFFLLSRIIGASFRMFLVVSILQTFVMDHFGVPFWVTVVAFILLIEGYTMKGGIKTIIWTDTLQTTFMLLAVLVSVFIILQHMDTSLTDMIATVCGSDLSTIIVTDAGSKENVVKLFFSGMFITIVMTGLDQDMMQKNLTCRNLKDAKKNIYLMSWALIPVNFLFLSMGALLYLYAAKLGIPIPARTDDLFPTIALQYHGAFAGIIFLIGLVAAAYSSADGSITALTTSFSIDILGIERNDHISQEQGTSIRKRVHIGFALLMFLLVLLFRAINDESVINKLFTIAGYTYGPLLGLYGFGLFTRRVAWDKWVPLVAILSPIVSYIISVNAAWWFNGYQFGFELLIINGMLTFLGLLFISNPSRRKRSL